MSAELLNQQANQLDQLLDLLTQERAILEQNDAQALHHVNQLKQQLLSAIEQTDRTLSQTISFVEQRQQGQWQAEIDQITEKLKNCQQQNAINGHIIEQSNQVVERLKSSLLESRAKSTMTYNAKGKTQGGLSSLGIKA